VTHVTDGLRRLNALSSAAAESALLTCCVSPRWAGAVAAARPFADRAALTLAADRAYAELAWADILAAMAAHPRIGERLADAPGDRSTTSPESRGTAWSRAEQTGVREAPEGVREALREGNLAYERRFGHIFLICATGLSADEMLTALRRRLTAEPETERRTAREELRKITHLRLGKLLESGPVDLAGAAEPAGPGSAGQDDSTGRPPEP
jgi:2-oxo-4-hydroxy-4-carboxy-5-ureidoimidazoline decarboxylase